MRTATRCGWLLLCVLLLAACGRSTVVRREQPTRSHHPPTHTTSLARSHSVLVRRGDTLYGIAFRAGVDFRELARWNRIAPPYTIYPGQRLELRPNARSSGVASSPPVVRTPSAPAPLPATPRPPAQRPPPSPPPAAPPLARAPVAWRWPTQGAVVSGFVAGDNTRQGIDIAGTAGQAIIAAAAGTVVYSGSGLVGYGELVIVKHSEEWLSAYGHNRRRLVAEGERVSAGQMIAEMGRTGASRDMLHFEIRRNGKPVDPLPLLPKR